MSSYTSSPQEPAHESAAEDYSYVCSCIVATPTYNQVVSLKLLYMCNWFDVYDYAVDIQEVAEAATSWKAEAEVMSCNLLKSWGWIQEVAEAEVFNVGSLIWLAILRIPGVVHGIRARVFRPSSIL